MTEVDLERLILTSDRHVVPDATRLGFGQRGPVNP